MLTKCLGTCTYLSFQIPLVIKRASMSKVEISCSTTCPLWTLLCARRWNRMLNLCHSGGVHERVCGELYRNLIVTIYIYIHIAQQKFTAPCLNNNSNLDELLRPKGVRISNALPASTVRKISSIWSWLNHNAFNRRMHSQNRNPRIHIVLSNCSEMSLPVRASFHVYLCAFISPSSSVQHCTSFKNQKGPLAKYGMSDRDIYFLRHGTELTSSPGRRGWIRKCCEVYRIIFIGTQRRRRRGTVCRMFNMSNISVCFESGLTAWVWVPCYEKCARS